MTTTDLVPFAKRVSHTYTAASGAVIVVMNVPAQVYQDDDGDEEIAYSGDVAERLDDLIKTQLVTAEPGAVVGLSYDGLPSLPDADYSFRWSGPEENFAHATVQTWRRVFDKTYNAIKAASQSVVEKVSALQFPMVAYVAPSSIVVAIRTTEQGRLFPFDTISQENPDKALNLLIDTSRWLDGEGKLPPEIESNAAALEALLRAVEALSPIDDKTTVSLQKIGRGNVPTVFSKKKHETARQQRFERRLRSSEGSRRIELVGEVSILDKKGRVTLRNVQKTSEWPSTVADCVFESGLLAQLLENFGHVVQVVAIQRQVAGTWETPEVLDVARREEPLQDPDE
jgi:hypothetical protein